MQYRNACHSCVYGRELDRTSHLKCTHPGTVREAPHFVAGVAGSDAATNLPGPLEIKGNEHGIKKGWFAWPTNFDPVWLEHCRGYLQRGSKR